MAVAAEPATAPSASISWANMAVKQAAKEMVAPSVPLVTDGTTAVVDTNAVVALSGTQVRRKQLQARSHATFSYCIRNCGHASHHVLSRDAPGEIQVQPGRPA